MAFEDHIKASVVNIRKDVPKSTDSFFVDTNVWYNYATTYTSLPDSYQKKYYPAYLSKMLHAKSRIFRSELVLAELSSVIEKSLYKIFIDTNGFEPDNLPLKNFRYDYPEERNNFIDELSITWDSVRDISESFDSVIDKSVSKFILKGFYDLYLDGYDLLFLDLIQKKMKNPCILTDDKDFGTVPGITVFTANNTIINAANDNCLLVVR
ncbi:MAG: PIN domain-containing protein [Euryarchaeota archaeon]|nr:PIN domain-containing protein [Euryarchaeota archaeon]